MTVSYWPLTINGAEKDRYIICDYGSNLLTQKDSKGEFGVFVAATSRCFSDLSMSDAISRLVDLEFTAIEIMIHESDGHLKPSAVSENLNSVCKICRKTQRLTPVAYSFDADSANPAYYEQFAACCTLAKATKVVGISVRSAELGTPFNAEIERLRDLVAISLKDGVRVGLVTEIGRMSGDPETAAVFCDNVPGLGITLDPSHYICGQKGEVDLEPLLKHTIHVRLRDTSKDELQVRIGQGLVEYGRLVSQLRKHKYNRALCVDIAPTDDTDQVAELRKMRLLLESLL